MAKSKLQIQNSQIAIATRNYLRIYFIRDIFVLRGPLAQLAEQLTLNQWVRGSSPRRIT